MNKIISMEDMIPLMEDTFQNNGEVTFTPKGISMLPLLRHNKDTVTLGRPEFPLKKYQIAFFLRDNGGYVLHRIVKVDKDSYVMRGDNQFVDEPGIRKEQIIGVVHSFTRKGKKYNGNEILYLLYCLIWVNTVMIRKWVRRTRRAAGRIKRRILRIFR